MGGREDRFDGFQLFAPVGTYFLGMKADHRIQIISILGTQGQDALRGLQVNGRHEHLPHPSLTSTLDNRFSVLVKLLAVNMAMGIYVKSC